MKTTIKVIPIQEGGAIARKNFKGTPFIRNTPEYDIVLKLGRIKGYNDHRCILGSDGNYVSGTDVIMLLNEAMTPKRVLNGMGEFIKLLDKAKIDPDIIVNDNIRAKLIAYKRRSSLNHSDNSDIPEEAARSSTSQESNVTMNNQPRVRLERINLDDYNHLRGQGIRKTRKRSSPS